MNETWSHLGEQSPLFLLLSELCSKQALPTWATTAPHEVIDFAIEVQVFENASSIWDSYADMVLSALDAYSQVARQAQQDWFFPFNPAYADKWHSNTVRSASGISGDHCIAIC